MKKTILFAMMAAVLGFAACSKEEPAQTETPREGMVLHATVAQPEDTKATFTDNEGIWHFDYAENDQITVTNKQISTYYTFTYNGTDFISTDAEPTSEPTRWYAYYPSNEVSLVGQTGKWEDLANVYALVGSTTYGKDVTGEDGLDITMDPKCAVLKIINQKGSIDINVMHKDSGNWIKGLKDSQASFVPTLGETKQTFLSTTELGTYYIAVPAGTPLTVYDGEDVIRSTSKGLTAGRYYELTISVFGQGYAEANGIGNVKWIQLWENGPKFAEFNVGATSISGYGCYYGWGGAKDKNLDDYWDGTELGDHDTATQLWGNNWRMPKRVELQELLNNCNVKWIDGNNDKYNGTTVPGLLCTGRGAFASNSVFLTAAGYYYYGAYGQGYYGYYWSSTPEGSNYAYGLDFDSGSQDVCSNGRGSGFSVRAVLAEK